MRRSTVAICAGGLIGLVGAAVAAEPWIEALRWQATPEATQAQRNADAPIVIHSQPTHRDGAPPTASSDAVRALAGVTSQPRPAASRDVPLPEPPIGRATPLPEPARGTDATRIASTGETISRPEAAPAEPGETPQPTLGPSPLRLAQTAFQFVDPPAPGANVRLTLSVENPTDDPAPNIALDLPLSWLDGYALRGVQPLPADNLVDGQQLGSSRRLTFTAPPPQTDLAIEVDLATTAEVIDAPEFVVTDVDGREIGRAHPPTEAPPGDPGPVYALDIPPLRLHTGVVQVDWEPPLFVVGQLRASAHVTEGNSVLVGHVRGAAGYNVFDHLDQVHVGDPIVAMSRGQTYDFVVTDTRVLPEEDMSPTEPTSAPRLTLMTCAGDWNPITRDYSARLWVIAQPADQALGPIAQTAPTPKPIASGDPIAPHGGLGNSDVDLAAAYGGPTGEAAPGVAVYAAHNGATHRALFADTSDGARRAILLSEHLATRDPRTLKWAAERARALLPRDVVLRSNGPEGNPRFAVERFSSATLSRLVSADTFTSADGAPGDLLVVYARDAAGLITDIIVGLGNDPTPLLAITDLR